MRLFSAAAIILTTFLTTSCGVVSLGGTDSHEPVPSGTVVESATIFAQNGADVSGAAVIYDQGGGSYVTRLEGVTFPSGILDVVTVTSQGTANTQQIVYDSGDMNYYFSYNPGGTWSFIQVEIYSPSLNSNVGLASF